MKPGKNTRKCKKALKPVYIEPESDDHDSEPEIYSSSQYVDSDTDYDEENSGSDGEELLDHDEKEDVNIDMDMDDQDDTQVSHVNSKAEQDDNGENKKDENTLRPLQQRKQQLSTAPTANRKPIPVPNQMQREVMGQNESTDARPREREINRPRTRQQAHREAAAAAALQRSGSDDEPREPLPGAERRRRHVNSDNNDDDLDSKRSRRDNDEQGNGDNGENPEFKLRESVSTRRSILLDQNQAYLASLRADEEKDRIKKQQEIEEAEMKKRLEEFMRLKKEAWNNLPPEVSADDAFLILLRLPSGKAIRRLFRPNDSIQILLQFAFSHEETPESFEIWVYDRAIFSTVNYESSKTLQEFGITKRQVFYIREIEDEQ